MTYINFTVDDATTYKGKLDESINLLREPPVTAGSGTAYTVAGWASLTLTDGLVYSAKAHTTNTGAVTVAGISTINFDASALSAGQIQQNQVIHLLYQSSGPSFLLLNPFDKKSIIEDTDLTLGNDFGSQTAHFVVTQLAAGYKCEIFLPVVTYSSATNINSITGIIPAAYRPSNTANNLFAISSGIEYTLNITSSGNVNINTSTSTISSQNETYISWYVAT